eukprot:1181220-Prorocentrum_minimum.AAC.1
MLMVLRFTFEGAEAHPLDDPRKAESRPAAVGKALPPQEGVRRGSGGGRSPPRGGRQSAPPSGRCAAAAPPVRPSAPAAERPLNRGSSSPLPAAPPPKGSAAPPAAGPPPSPPWGFPPAGAWPGSPGRRRCPRARGPAPPPLRTTATPQRCISSHPRPQRRS